MPYNTRRKSLSLPSLGIQLPNTARPHRSNSKTSIPGGSALEQPPSKKLKREHDSASPLSSPRESPATLLKQQQRPHAVTPPPSPGDVTGPKRIDTEGINDDVVVSVIEQLQSTGNRPHLIRELATILGTTNKSIKNSANPAALLSSRLTTYMKRPWTALSPCPIAKELVPVHPRKVFYFLTYQPRGELPQNSDDIIPPVLADLKRLTPSISDPSIDENAEIEHFERTRMSPSPEVDLFSPELHHDTPIPPTPGSSFSGRESMSLEVPPQTRPRLNRAPSPGLEADEKGFTETASAVRAIRIAQASQPQSPVDASMSFNLPEPKPQTDHDVRVELFGRSHGYLVAENKAILTSSPMLQAKEPAHNSLQDLDVDMSDATWTIRGLELADMDELDEMFAEYC